MKIIKFGGTAFQTPKLVENVVNLIKKEEKPLIVVVSAIGRKGFPFATDTLIDSIKESYLSKKEMDRLLSLGEIYSTLFLSNSLNKNEIKAYALSYLECGIETNDNHLEGNIISLNDENHLKYFKEYDVLVVPGFIGSTGSKEVITLGRGTSDLTAVELARLHKEKEVILYKEVDGIYPTLFANLNRLKTYDFLSYNQVKALIKIGFNIVNEKAILEAEKDNISIKIKNFTINENETLISLKESKNKVLGFNVDNNVVKVATFFGEEIKKELIEIFKQYHIYVKEEDNEIDYFSFKISNSQLLLIRQILLKTYFFDMLM